MRLKRWSLEWRQRRYAAKEATRQRLLLLRQEARRRKHWGSSAARRAEVFRARREGARKAAETRRRNQEATQRARLLIVRKDIVWRLHKSPCFPHLRGRLLETVSRHFLLTDHPDEVIRRIIEECGARCRLCRDISHYVPDDYSEYGFVVDDVLCSECWRGLKLWVSRRDEFAIDRSAAGVAYCAYILSRAPRWVVEGRATHHPAPCSAIIDPRQRLQKHKRRLLTRREARITRWLNIVFYSTYLSHYNRYRYQLAAIIERFPDWFDLDWHCRRIDQSQIDCERAAWDRSVALFKNIGLIESLADLRLYRFIPDRVEEFQSVKSRPSCGRIAPPRNIAQEISWQRRSTKKTA